MRKFYLIANSLKEGTQETAEKIAEYLQDKGASCIIEGWKEQPVSEVPKDTECVITLGGDGTLIRAAKKLYMRNIPILGINMGTLGYLTQISRDEELPPVLDTLLKDEFRLEHRMMLEGELIEKGKILETGIALNEIVISRDGGMQPIHFDLYVNGYFLNSYTADGMIIATPTGSTAYNLSAGGPVVTPGAELMVMTPICSHALNSSSIVLNGKDEIEIQVKDPIERKQAAVFDGDHTLRLNQNRKFRIHKSLYETTLICVKEVSFLDNLRNKMTRI